ncbi:hypothetical protein V6N13_043230 [Hibiscus sabdariffa]|uniref:Uncharacterized protein n=1 Tax=Hibiscus sabdariffa TaxID=183260 RepID=A0ABR2G258_9ROSI
MEKICGFKGGSILLFRRFWDIMSDIVAMDQMFSLPVATVDSIFNHFTAMVQNFCLHSETTKKIPEILSTQKGPLKQKSKIPVSCGTLRSYGGENLKEKRLTERVCM